MTAPLPTGNGDVSQRGARGDCPFVPGARVAVECACHSEGVREDFVEKVYKTGKFTLRGAPKDQWRPEEPWEYQPRWSAERTGGGWRSDRLKIWDETTDAEIKERFAQQDRSARWRKVTERVETLRWRESITEDLIASIEAALARYDAALEAPARPSLPGEGR